MIKNILIILLSLIYYVFAHNVFGQIQKYQYFILDFNSEKKCDTISIYINDCLIFEELVLIDNTDKKDVWLISDNGRGIVVKEYDKLSRIFCKKLLNKFDLTIDYLNKKQTFTVNLKDGQYLCLEILEDNSLKLHQQDEPFYFQE